MPTLVVGMLWFFRSSNMPTTSVGMAPILQQRLNYILPRFVDGE